MKHRHSSQLFFLLTTVIFWALSIHSAWPAEMVINDLTVNPGLVPGQLRIQFTAPDKTGGGPVAAYEVRYSELQITDTNYTAMTIYPQSWMPVSPGMTESHILSGLPEGQTIYVAVKPDDGLGTLGEIGTVVSANVQRACIPEPPPGAVPVSAPATLDTPGAYYYLTNDITATGTAISITADNIVFDLRGYTIIYGTTTTGGQVFGVYSTANDNITVMNGTVIQGSTSDNYSHGVYLRSGSNFETHDMTITVQGPDAYPLHHMYATNVHDHHNTICNNVTYVTDRHYPGNHSIRLAAGGGNWEIDHNQIYGGPQWGIYVTRDASGAPGYVRIHHNRIENTRSYVTNGYLIGCHAANAVVYENYCVGESRGFHLAEPNLEVHDNYLDVKEFPNPEYPVYFVHGIKFEGTSDSVVYRNVTTAHADPGYGDARCLDMSLYSGTQGNKVYDNVFKAITTDPGFTANAIAYTTGDTGHISDISIHHNIFISNNRMVLHQWNGGNGASWEQNVFVRDYSGSPPSFIFRWFDIGGSSTAYNMNHLDDMCMGCDVTQFDQRPPAGPYDVTVQWTLDIYVVDGSDNPVEGATVLVMDNTMSTVFTGLSGPDGKVSGTVTEMVGTNGPSIDDRNDHTLQVTAPGFTGYTGTVTMDSHTAVIVDVETGVAAKDSSLPNPPTGFEVYPVSASRSRLFWDPATDNTMVTGYLIYRDTELVGITNNTEYFDSGLDPITSYSYTIASLDDAWNQSSMTRPVTIVTKEEDRGTVPPCIMPPVPFLKKFNLILLLLLFIAVEGIESFKILYIN